jgi:hypothetical protein
MCVDKKCDLSHLIALVADHKKDSPRIAAVNSHSELTSILDVCLQTRTSIINKAKSDDLEIDAKNMTTEIGRQLLRAKVTHPDWFQIGLLAKLLAEKVPHNLSLDDAVAMVLNANPDFNADLVRIAIGDQKTEMIDRVKAMKAIGNARIIGSIEEAREIIEKADRGIYIIKAPIGSGKTRFLAEPLIAKAFKSDEIATYISHRRSISRAAMNIDDLVHYEDFDFCLNEGQKGLNIVVNSTIKPVFRDVLNATDLLIVDEAQQTLEHIIDGSVSEREFTLTTLIKTMSSSKKVVLMDAEANDLLVQAARRTGRPVHVLQMPNDYSHIRIDVADIDVTTSLLDNAIAAHQPVFVAADSKVKARSLALKFAKDYPEKRFLCITAENVDNADQQAFLANPNEEALKYDGLFFSPVIVSSVSITVDHFKAHFGFFIGKLLPSNCMQQLRRDRTATQFYVGLSNRQKRLYGKDTVESLKGLHAGESFSFYDELWFQFEANKRFTQNHFQMAFIENAELDGYRVSQGTYDIDMGSSGRHINNQARRLEKKDYTEKVLAATPADNEMVASSKEKFAEHDTESFYALERARIEEIFNTDEIGVEEVQLWARGGLVKHLNNFRYAVRNIDVAHEHRLDTKRAKRDKQYPVQRDAMYALIFSTLGINPRTGEGEYDFDRAQNLLLKLYENRKVWNLLGHTIATTKWKKNANPVRVVNELLKEIFGFKVARKRVRTGEEFTRINLLNAGHFDRVRRLVCCNL